MKRKFSFFILVVLAIISGLLFSQCTKEESPDLSIQQLHLQPEYFEIRKERALSKRNFKEQDSLAQKPLCEAYQATGGPLGLLQFVVDRCCGSCNNWFVYTTSMELTVYYYKEVYVGGYGGALNACEALSGGKK